MKFLHCLLGLVLGASCEAAVTYSSKDEIVLYQQLNTYTSIADCESAADAISLTASAVFACKDVRTITATYTVDPVCSAAPAVATQSQPCPTGTTGSWNQTAGWVSAPYPTCWTAAAWTPTTAPNGACVPVVVSTSGAPMVLYTDLASGANSGGENGKGSYLSIFGKNFGSAGLGSSVKVYIGGAEVDNYRSIGVSRARSDVQQITVQVGSLANAVKGFPLPIKVVVNGVASNVDQTFIVNPGKFYFVDNVNGNDSTGVADDVTHPFRFVQTAALYTGGVWPLVHPGDTIVMRGTGTPWTDMGFEGYFMRFRDKSGSAPTGSAGSGPITIVGYPGEDVFINTSKSAGFSGAISGINGQSFPGMGQWGTVSNLRVEGGGDDGAIDFEILGHHWRVVNNELTAATAQATARAGGITGNGTGIYIYGNYIHDVNSPDPGLENHGIYIDNDGSYDIGYNYIKDIRDGNGLQLYTYGFTSGTQYTQNVVFHHNWINGSQKHGLNIGDGTKAGIVIYNNVIMNSHDAGLRFNTNTLVGAKIYNNTFYISNLYGKDIYGMIMNDWNLPKGALDIENNIFVPTAIGTATGISSAYNLVSLSGAGVFKNNLWFNGTGSTTLDTAAITSDPKFVAPGVDFHLQTGSPAINAGSSLVSGNDYELNTRPRPGNAKASVGAFE